MTMIQVIGGFQYMCTVQFLWFKLPISWEFARAIDRSTFNQQSWNDYHGMK